MLKRSHADFLEPHHVAGIKILKADVAGGRAFDVSDELGPALARRQLGGGVEGAELLAIDLDADSFAFECDDSSFHRRVRLVLCALNLRRNSL